MDKSIESSRATVTDSFLAWLNDTGVKLSHRLVEDVKLGDIYVVPDMQEYDDKTEKLLDINTTYSILENNDDYLISGDEQTGKTSLFKFLYIEILKKSELCLYVDAKNINKNYNRSIKESIENQYESLSFEDFMTFDKKTILIDNFEKISLNNGNASIFIDYLKDNGIRVVASCESNYSYISNDVSSFDGFERPKLIELGHQKREELIKKWMSLGKEESISSELENYRQTDQIKNKIDSILKKNIVPARPIYILMILQMFEAHKKLNVELTSYGHCYQQLIYSSFESGKINKDGYEKYLNVLTELSWWIFNSRRNLNDHDLDQFFNDYEERFLSTNRDVVIKNLLNCSILVRDDSKCKFKYPYIYYFFVAKKIAESYMDVGKTKDAMQRLLNNLHKEDYANILIFVTHHTKNSWIVESISSCLESQFNSEIKRIYINGDFIFKDLIFLEKKSSSRFPYVLCTDSIVEADFSKDQLKFIQNFMTLIPSLVIEQREISLERKKKNDYLDSQERDVNQDQDKDDDLSYDILAKINKVFKSMEIAGQIINNRHASAEKKIISNLASEGIDAGLRFLNFFLNISNRAQESIVRFIAENISLDSDMTNNEVKEHAEQAYLQLTYNVLYATIQKIAHSIGSKEAFEVYKEIEETKNTPVHALIKLSIDLQFNKNLNIQEITKLNKAFSNNIVCQRLMKQLVIQHIYMYPVDFREKQKISELLEIPLKKQRWLESESKGAGLKLRAVTN